MSTDAPAASTLNVQIAPTHLAIAAAVTGVVLVTKKIVLPAFARAKQKAVETAVAPQA